MTAASPPSITAHPLFRAFETLADAPGGVAKFRGFILELAVHGKLVPQKDDEEPVSELLARLNSLKRRATSIASSEHATDSQPNGWAFVCMGEIVEQRLGKMLDKAKNKGTPLPYLRNTNVQWMRFILDDIKEMRFEDDEIEEFELRPGDLLVCEGGEPGRCAIWEGQRERMMFQKAIHRLRPFAGIDARFLALRLRADALTERLAPYFTGATIKHFTGKELSRYSFPLPPTAEQARIVAKVDELMALCDALEARQRTRASSRQRLHAATLHQLLAVRAPYEISAHWRRLHTHFDTLHATPDSIPALRQTILQLAIQGRLVPQIAKDGLAAKDLALIECERARLIQNGTLRRGKSLPIADEADFDFDLPPGWSATRFGNIALNIEAGSSPNCYSRQREGDEWGVLKISAVSWDEFDPEENKALPPNIEPNLADEVRSGDFLMSRANTAELVAKSVVVRDTPPRLLLNDKTLRVRFSEHTDVRFMNLLNNSTHARAYYARTASGTSASMKNISRDGIVLMPLALPPLAEQKRIVAKVEQLLALCDELEAKLTGTDTRREHLLAAAIHNLVVA
jgi:type I restriction enzyme S subunit